MVEPTNKIFDLLPTSFSPQVTTMVEKKMAQLVVIAHDVEPIELVMHLPALCRLVSKRDESNLFKIFA